MSSTITTIERKHFPVMKPENALMLGLLGICIAACLTRSKAVHVAAGALFTGAIAHHMYKRRKML